MIAFLCHIYGGTPGQWLDEPVQLFFGMYREAVKIEARQHAEAADLALIPQMKLSYYFGLKQRYARMIDPKQAQLPPRPGGPVLEAGSEEALLAMRSVGSALKGAMGYGRR